MSEPSTTRTTLTVPLRFRGPPTSGNGGYVSGQLAACLGGSVEVTLRKPPPLDRTLHVETETDRARLLDGDVVIADAARCELELVAPRAPSLVRAEEWSRGYAGFLSHAFPECFSCGPARGVDDGLRIFPGRSPDDSMVAAVFEPTASLADEHGNLSTPIVWAALDCSGYFATAHPDFALLGKMCTRVDAPLSASQRYVVTGWPLGREGRKVHAATAIYDAKGTALAVSRQTWISITR